MVSKKSYRYIGRDILIKEPKPSYQGRTEEERGGYWDETNVKCYMRSFHFRACCQTEGLTSLSVEIKNSPNPKLLGKDKMDLNQRSIFCEGLLARKKESIRPILSEDRASNIPQIQL